MPNIKLGKGSLCLSGFCANIICLYSMVAPSAFADSLLSIIKSSLVAVVILLEVVMSY